MADSSVLRGARAPRSKLTASLLAVFFLVSFVVFVLLGSWQVQRRAWKLDLIERVEQRVKAPATQAPDRADWPAVSKATDEYRHVAVEGVLQHGKETLVQAATVKGGGFWVLTPLTSADGSTVLVNRGFVPPENRTNAAHGGEQPKGTVRVSGLLRLTEPVGGFLRKNDAAGDRWFSRDVEAIAAARGLQNVAPYFIDADAAPSAAAEAPVGGLTVVSFPNSHLVYALTWFGLAAMVLVGAAIWLREELRLRRAAA